MFRESKGGNRTEERSINFFPVTDGGGGEMKEIFYGEDEGGKGGQCALVAHSSFRSGEVLGLETSGKESQRGNNSLG